MYEGEVIKGPALAGATVNTEVAWFLVICFGLAWTIWEAAILSGVSISSPAFQLYALPGAFAPAAAGIVVRKWITREGFGDAGLRLRLRAWPYYVFGWLLPFFVVGAILAETRLLGFGSPSFGVSGALTAVRCGLIALVSTPLLWGEEFGWRGYLQSRIFVGRPIAAAVATGVVWAVWHYPLTLRGYNYPDHPVLGTGVFTVFTVLISYIFGWIRERSGTIWASSLAHAATNAVGGGLTYLWLAGVKGPMWTGYGGVLAVPVLLAVCLCLPRRAPPQNL